MSQSKRGLAILVVVTILLFLAGCRTGSTTGGGLADAIRPIFGTLPSLIAGNADDTGVIYARFILFIATFALFYYGVGIVFTKNNNPSAGRVNVAISFALALIATIGIPRSWIISLVHLYSFAIAMVFALVPIVVGLYLTKKVPGNKGINRVIRAIIYFFIAYCVQMLIYAVDQVGDPQLSIVADWGVWAVLICVVAGIFNLLGMFGGQAMNAADSLGAARQRVRGPGGTAPATPAAGSNPAQAPQEAAAGQPPAAAAAQQAQQQQALQDIDGLIDAFENRRI